MLDGNVILERSFALFQRDFSSALRDILRPPSKATRLLTEHAHVFLHEVTFYLKTIKTGECSFYRLEMFPKGTRLFSLFHLYRTMEKFLLNSFASQAEPSEKFLVAKLEKELKDKILFYFFALIPVMRLNYTNLDILYTKGSGYRAIAVTESSAISLECYDNLQKWTQKFIAFRRDPRVLKMNYEDLHANYEAGVNARNADKLIHAFLQAEYRDFQSFYLDLQCIVNLFSFSIVDPTPADTQLVFLQLLLNLYREMMATAIFAEQDQYVEVLREGTNIYVHRASFFWEPPFVRTGSNCSIHTYSSGYGSEYMTPPSICAAPIYELPEHLTARGASMIRCDTCLRWCDPVLIRGNGCSFCASNTDK